MNDESNLTSDLRGQAEALTRVQAARFKLRGAKELEDIKTLSPEEIQQTLHQLQIHQIELELQNEELRAAQAALEKSRERYFDLYDLAPVGYCNLSESGLLLETNLTAATLLGETRKAMIGQPFSRYIFPEDQDIYSSRRKHLFETGEFQECEIRLLKPDGAVVWVHLTATVTREIDGTPICRLTLSDISRRRQAEEQIQFQSQLLSNIRESIVATDLKGHITYWSQGAKELYGYLPEEMTGKPITLIVAPDDQQEENERIQQTLEQGAWRGQYIQRRKDGNFFLADTVFSLMQDAHGQTCGLISIDRDLTELRRVMDELKESNRLLENGRQFITHILDSIPSSMLVMDQNLRIISANRNFLEKTHQDERTILGRQLEEAFPQVLVEYARLKQKAQDVFRTGRKLEGERVAYRAPGLPSRIYYYRLIPLKASNMVENVMLLMDDITEQQKLEEEVQRVESHLASVVECANDIVISMDAAGRIVTWNQAAERLSGLKSEQVRGHSLASFCADGQQAMMTDILRELACGQIVQHAEVDLVTVDGLEVPIAWSFSLMRGDSGKVIGLVAVGRDLTLRRQLEIQLIQSAKAASLGVMAGGIAHELRNPLGIISASVQLIRDYPDNVDLRNQAVEKSYAATQRASLIIENLLKFARSQDMQMTLIDVRTVLDNTLVLLNSQIKLNNIQICKDFCSSSRKLYGNSELLQQVFSNLILNACNAMPNGGVLTLSTQTIKTGMVEIRLTDTGVGIPPTHLSKIFDPFFTTMPVGKGVGLGLSISYSIIQRHQGSIDVESQVGKGSTFIIRLPIGD